MQKGLKLNFIDGWKIRFSFLKMVLVPGHQGGGQLQILHNRVTRIPLGLLKSERFVHPQIYRIKIEKPK